jgi:glycosyltransferase involved in cell wall biosynthesis
LTVGIAPYIDTCFRALHERGNELFVVRPATLADTSYDDSSWCDYATSLVWEEPPSRAELMSAVGDFAPDVIVMGTWTRPTSYRAVIKAQPPGVLRILFMDSQWHGTPKQRAVRATRGIFIRPVFDCAMVPGDRTEYFARRLGFASKDIIRGGYTADTEVFDGGQRSGAELAQNRTFLFAGRLVPEKAVDVLAAAYARYRELTDDPWDLRVIGIGELEKLFTGIPGVTRDGFLQPSELAALMHRASCLILPSRFDPHPLVVHEAATAGLPLLVSDASGSGPSLLQDGYNGWVVPAGDVELWSDAMLRMSQSSPERLEEMSAGSRALSTRFSPAGWARNLHEEAARRVNPQPAATLQGDRHAEASR